MANRLIMCLSCGKNFANIEEAQAHVEFYRQEEQRTRVYLDQPKTSWTTTLGNAEGPPQNVYIPAHVVQISDPVGVT